MKTELTWLPSYAERADGLAVVRDHYIMCGDGNIFNNPHGCGYWLYGVEFDAALGWLAMETGGDIDVRNVDHEPAMQSWRRNKKLPPKYFALNEDVVLRCYDNGCRKWGERWTDDIDLPHMDEVVQFTILGEIRYG